MKTAVNEIVKTHSTVSYLEPAPPPLSPCMGVPPRLAENRPEVDWEHWTSELSSDALVHSPGWKRTKTKLTALVEAGSISPHNIHFVDLRPVSLRGLVSILVVALSMAGP